jgi:hypothetical protein
MGAIPVPRNLRKHQVTVPNAGEWVDWILYDTQIYTDNVTTRLNFFLGTQASIVDGNMETGGQMPGQKMFLLRGIGVEVLPPLNTSATTAPLIDVIALVHHGALRLNIGSKSYSEWPLFLLSAGGGTYGSPYTAGATVTYGTNGIPDPRACYGLARPLLLTSNLNFSAQIEWAAALNITANVRVRVLLKGELGRPVQ